MLQSFIASVERNEANRLMWVVVLMVLCWQQYKKVNSNLVDLLQWLLLQNSNMQQGSTVFALENIWQWLNNLSVIIVACRLISFSIFEFHVSFIGTLSAVS